ncbi:hypothetical protein AAC387_Pa01g3994 [Persea americana]
MNWGSRVASRDRDTSFTLVRVQSQAMMTKWCCGSMVLRQLVWRLKSQWRQFTRSRRRRVRFSYDLHSYSQNFDDGSLHHLSC